MSKINIPLKLNLKGEVKAKLIDTRNGKTEIIKENNLTLNQHVKEVFSNHFVPIIHWDSYDGKSANNYQVVGNMMWCEIGTSNQAVTKMDPGCISPISTVSGINHDRSAEFEAPVFAERKFTFPAGNGTGTIREAAIKSETLTGQFYTARVVFVNEIVKEDYHELVIYWKRILERGVEVTGTITGGQKDGITDVNWTATINDKQIFSLCGYRSAIGQFFNEFSGISFDDGKVIVGDSNTASDLVNDPQNNLKGTELYNGAIKLKTIEPYTDGNYQRKFRFGFDVNDSNGQIGEMLLCRESANAAMRITFDPKLDKTSSYRLYFDIIISLNVS